MLWHRLAAWAAPLLSAAPLLAELDAEACFRLYSGAGVKVLSEMGGHRRQDRRRYDYMYMPPLTASTWPVM